MKNNKNSILMISLLATSLHIYTQDDERLDVMVDFSYPVLEVESMRQDISQGVYFLQQSAHGSDQFQRAVDLFEQADSRAINRENMTSDDEDFLQAMLDQINTLIASLEDDNSHRAILSDVYDRLQSKL